MDGPTLFDVTRPQGPTRPAGEASDVRSDADVDATTYRAVSGDDGARWRHPSTGGVGLEADEYRRRVRRAAAELGSMASADTRRELAARGRERSRRRLEDPRDEVREAERSRRRLLRVVACSEV